MMSIIRLLQLLIWMCLVNGRVSGKILNYLESVRKGISIKVEPSRNYYINGEILVCFGQTFENQTFPTFRYLEEEDNHGNIKLHSLSNNLPYLILNQQISGKIRYICEGNKGLRQLMETKAPSKYQEHGSLHFNKKATISREFGLEINVKTILKCNGDKWKLYTKPNVDQRDFKPDTIHLIRTAKRYYRLNQFDTILSVRFSLSPRNIAFKCGQNMAILGARHQRSSGKKASTLSIILPNKTETLELNDKIQCISSDISQSLIWEKLDGPDSRLLAQPNGYLVNWEYTLQGIYKYKCRPNAVNDINFLEGKTITIIAIKRAEPVFIINPRQVHLPGDTIQCTTNSPLSTTVLKWGVLDESDEGLYFSQSNSIFHASMTLSENLNPGQYKFKCYNEFNTNIQKVYEFKVVYIDPMTCQNTLNVPSSLLKLGILIQLILFSYMLYVIFLQMLVNRKNDETYSMRTLATWEPNESCRGIKKQPIAMASSANLWTTEKFEIKSFFKMFKFDNHYNKDRNCYLSSPLYRWKQLDV